MEENNSPTENQMQDHWLDLPVLQELRHDHTINTPHDHPMHVYNVSVMHFAAIQYVLATRIPIGNTAPLEMAVLSE